MKNHTASHSASCSVGQSSAHIPVRPLAAMLLALAAGLLLTAPAAFADGDAAAGKDKAQTCAACHGLNGISTSDQFPILAGQYKDYLIQALHEYKSGARTNSIMKGMAAGLSEDDIQNLAQYFSGLPGPLNNIPQGGH